MECDDAAAWDHDLRGDQRADVALGQRGQCARDPQVVAQRLHRVDQRLHLVADAVRERHFDEDDRLVGQRRVKVRKAAPVRLQSSAQKK